LIYFDLAMIPQDLANLLAVAIRDVIWFKDNVRSFLTQCGVDAGILGELPRSEPTIKLVHYVLSRLDKLGSHGRPPAQEMLTRMYYWRDLHTIPAERKDQAIRSLKEFRQGYDLYKAQIDYQEEKERNMHEERTARGKLKPLDHVKLQGFRDEFDSVHAESNQQTRGNRFQALMNDIFEYYSEQSKGPFKRIGEQIDGQFYFDKHWYYVEVRWKKEQAIAADVSVLRDRATHAFGGDTKALFISFNGFSTECLDSLEGKSDERVVLMDGVDLRCVLDCQIGFDVLLGEKQGDMVRGRPFTSAGEIIQRRAAS
jgi:hypothetical protein